MNPALKTLVLIKCIDILFLIASSVVHCFRGKLHKTEYNFITDQSVLTSLVEQTGECLNHRPLGIAKPCLSVKLSTVREESAPQRCS